MTNNPSDSNANGKPASIIQKQQLPETKFFYALAMQRSAEIKSQGEMESQPEQRSSGSSEM